MDSALQSFNKRTNPCLDKETLNKMYAHMAKTYDKVRHNGCFLIRDFRLIYQLPNCQMVFFVNAYGNVLQ